MLSVYLAVPTLQGASGGTTTTKVTTTATTTTASGGGSTCAAQWGQCGGKAASIAGPEARETMRRQAIVILKRLVSAPVATLPSVSPASDVRPAPAHLGHSATQTDACRPPTARCDIDTLRRRFTALAMSPAATRWPQVLGIMSRRIIVHNFLLGAASPAHGLQHLANLDAWPIVCAVPTFDTRGEWDPRSLGACGNCAVPDIEARSIASHYSGCYSSAPAYFQRLRRRLVKDSDGTATRRPVRARPSSARSSRRAPHPDLWASVTDTRIDERALFRLCHRVALQLIFVSLHTSLDVRRNFPAHSNDSAARRPVRALGTSSTSTCTSSAFASRASRSECAHAVGARPRLSGSGNRVPKQPTIELFSEGGLCCLSSPLFLCPHRPVLLPPETRHISLQLYTVLPPS
ncbi:hypothetical protein DFH08DRAFT_1085683, partial [Mycena albidolilacea]